MAFTKRHLGSIAGMLMFYLENYIIEQHLDFLRYVPHDTNHLIQLMGGNVSNEMTKKLLADTEAYYTDRTLSSSVWTISLA